VKQLNAQFQKIDALTLRERVILFVLMLAGIWALLDTLLLSPQETARLAEQNKITLARTHLAEAEQILLLRASTPDPDQAGRQRLENARRGLEARMQTAQHLQARMVAPKDMPRMLQAVLSDHPGLRLASLETLPPEAVGVEATVNTTASRPATTLPTKASSEEAALFKHGIKLTLNGDYASLTGYMEKLERLPLGFYWSRAELDATAHPEISLTLTLYTLSLERTWLTV
jgi:MSHA biogenesis protein MshJ